MAVRSIKTWVKDPDAALDYTIRWTTWLGSDTIKTSAWTISSSLTEITNTMTTTSATVWVSGGSTGHDYTLTNRIVTDGGRTEDRTIKLTCRQR